MAKLDERMQMIGSAIINQAKLEAKELIDKANNIRDNEITKCESDITSEMFNKVQQNAADLRQRTVSEIAKTQIKSSREIHLHREELSRRVFADVEKRLLEYAGTGEYKTQLLEDAKALKDSYDHSASTLFLREADLGLAADIKAFLGCKVEADPEIKLGGFKLFNLKSRVLVDETLDARLEAQKPWFLANCGMKIM